VLILLLNSVGLEWDNKMLVSTGNKIGTDLSFKASTANFLAGVPLNKI
jgi:hypothetical protein